MALSLVDVPVDPLLADLPALVAAPLSARDAFVRQVLDGLPLAQTVLALQAYVLQPTLLADLFAQHRGRHYEDTLTFAHVVQLMADALQQHHGSARQSLRQAAKAGTLPTTAHAFYGKLSRLPIALSVGLVAETGTRLQALLPPVVANPLPRSLDGLHVYMIDGKKVKRAAKRLLATRGHAGKLFGAKLLAAWQPTTGTVLAVAADPDGEKNDAPLVPDLLVQVRRLLPGSRLLVADRQFCDLVHIQRCLHGGDHFLLRYHPKVHFHPDPQRPAQASTDGRGRPVVQEWGWLGAATDKRRVYVRRITLTRAGAEAVILVTDLSDAAAYPATDLLDVYRIRWGIERVFQQITEVFHLQKLISSTPQGTVFQAAFCMVLYNLIQVVRSYIAVEQPQPLRVEEVSSEMLFTDVHKQLIALTALTRPEEIHRCLPSAQTKEDMIALLQGGLRHRWEEGWRKAVNKRPRPQMVKAKRSGAHTSVHRLLEKQRQKNNNARSSPQ